MIEQQFNRSKGDLRSIIIQNQSSKKVQGKFQQKFFNKTKVKPISNQSLVHMIKSKMGPSINRMKKDRIPTHENQNMLDSKKAIPH